jgi:primosomal protein N' (replication factor Y) (superfamily II helicase)
MKYVEVLVADASFHGHDALTYSAQSNLEAGRIVVVPLRAKQVMGIVVRCVPKPAFAAKAIISCPDLPPLPAATFKTIQWMQQYYPSPFGVIVQQFLPKKLPLKMPEVAERPQTAKLPALPPLTHEQAAALAQITNEGMYLLHGETGTGKTRLYIELARRSLATGKSAIILTPEIGLTSQLEQDFRSVFGSQVVVIHSRLTDVTRQKLWVACLKRAEPAIIIGPRSALFMPLRDVGLVVVDEAHETAYKQDQAPYYHTSRVASVLASLHKAPVILGSATPLVTDYYLAEAKKRPIIRLTQTARKSLDPLTHSVSVIDLKDHSKFTRNPYLSDELIAAVKDTLRKHEQTLLFLNRRGTARVIFCEKCGWQAVCPHCDLPLVYHGDQHLMRCHTCDFKAAPPSSCPDCRAPSIVFKSIGTKAIEEEISRLFPEARVQRFDTDNKKADRIEEHYDAVKRGDVDIIIGTQTLAKGLDLPQLGLVGVLIADTSLYFPDFSATERTYQLLSQVIGRVGRGHRSGKAIVQTYAPDSPLLKSILGKDWPTFYQSELHERKTFLFPPFCYLLKLTCRRASAEATQKAAEMYAGELRRSGGRIIVEGPAPAFHEKIQNKYQWQLIIKAKNRRELTDIITKLPSGWSYDIDPMNLL